MDLRVILLLMLEMAFAFFLLYRSGLVNETWQKLVSLLLLLFAFILRFVVLDYETLDYQHFLTVWVDFFRDRGGFAALQYPVGNYNIPYLYFMALFSYSSIKDLYLIKLLSIFFDVLLAYAAARLLSRFCQSPARRLALFFTVLLLPTVYLNGSVWGQCDSIYVSLALLGICLALEDKPVSSMICMALSFGFKLQAVFILPVCALLWFMGKYKLWHFFVFPAAYVLLVLPAVIAGRPFMDTLLLYFGQTGSIGSGLNYSAPSLFAIITDVKDTALASKLGILAAFAFMLAVLLPGFLLRKRLSPLAILGGAVLLTVGIPFLLPHMHDRYFFPADIMSLVMAFALPGLFPAAVFCQFGSLLGYHAYLKQRFFLPMSDGAHAMLLALLLALLCYCSGFFRKNSDIEKIVLDKS